jgi:hypothetical protein
MTLVDFYELAVLHNLSRGDTRIHSNPSHPPPMSAATPLNSRSLSIESNCTHSQYVTTVSLRTAVRQRLELSTDCNRKHDSASCEQYILQDFERHQVFVDIDAFMKNVLHVPENWKDLWRRTIRRVKRDKVFATAHWDYSRLCGTEGVQEWRLSESLVDMGNAILDLSESPMDAFVEPQTAPSRYSKRKLGPSTTGLPSLDQVSSVPDLPMPRKRPADEPLVSSRKTQKVHYRSTPGGASGRVAERGPRGLQTNEPDRQKEAYIQVGRYLLEQFSVPAFRSHATIGLVDRDRIQFYHANHSVILVSSAISFSASDRTGGLDKLIAIVIAFSRLSLCDNGILHNLHDGKLFRDNGDLPTSKLAHGAVRMQEGNKLEFGGNEGTEPFTLTYGEVISHEPSLAGRSTAVLHATSPKWKDIDLVVKISWPGSDRIPENLFLEKAIKTANSAPAGKWALNHLPRVLFAQDVVFGSDSTHGKVGSLFDDAKFVDGEYKYERRTLRIIIQERLYPLKTLTNVKDIAQVLLDVACSTRLPFASWISCTYAGSVHRWLRDHAGILHRDLSLNNIMYRIIKQMNDAGVAEEKVYGVLADYDLASWTRSLTPDYTKTSQQRTGTPPYMAHGLLDGSDSLHLYRHDVESLFYIMLILATHHEIQAPEKEKNGGVRMREGELPYRRWFDQPLYEDLASFKQTFFLKLNDLDLSPSFKDFRGWLTDLRRSFRQGFRSREDYKDELDQLKRDGGSEDGTTPTFDDETLGGHIRYSALIGPARKLRGKLEGLIIRCGPPPPPSTGPAKADG